jgi:hypothetical protein
VIGGDNAAGIAQVGREYEIELVARVDFVDRHQRALLHLARHHGVRSRLGKYQTERDGRLSHEATQALCGRLSHRKYIDLSPCIINPHCASFVLRPHKKGAGLALTRLATLRHNHAVREYVHGERISRSR